MSIAVCFFGQIRYGYEENINSLLQHFKGQSVDLYACTDITSEKKYLDDIQEKFSFEEFIILENDQESKNGHDKFGTLYLEFEKIYQVVNAIKKDYNFVIVTRVDFKFHQMGFHDFSSLSQDKLYCGPGYYNKEGVQNVPYKYQYFTHDDLFKVWQVDRTSYIINYPLGVSSNLVDHFFMGSVKTIRNLSKIFIILKLFLPYLSTKSEIKIKLIKIYKPIINNSFVFRASLYTKILFYIKKYLDKKLGIYVPFKTPNAHDSCARHKPNLITYFTQQNRIEVEILNDLKYELIRKPKI
tara:strand:+ start:11615 stop:12505 length:891 start_codon:yes stop_codon:yes gene_type:complete